MMLLSYIRQDLMGPVSVVFGEVPANTDPRDCADEQQLSMRLHRLAPRHDAPAFRVTTDQRTFHTAGEIKSVLGNRTPYAAKAGQTSQRDKAPRQSAYHPHRGHFSGAVIRHRVLRVSSAGMSGRYILCA